MYKSNKIYILQATLLLICCFFISSLSAQIHMEGKIEGEHKSPIYAGYYCASGYVPVSVSKKGKYKALLPRFEECILIFLQKGCQSVLLSVNTDNHPQQIINYNVKLLKSQDGSSPTLSTRVITTEKGFSLQTFDLDKVMDKTTLARLMGDAIMGIKLFCENNILPKATTTKVIIDNSRHNIHELGKEIYRLSEVIKKKQQHLIKTENIIAKKRDCQSEQQYLAEKMSLEKIKWELSLLKINKHKANIQQQELAGKASSNHQLKKATHYEKQQELNYHIASTEFQNKQLDCQLLAASFISDSLLKNISLDNLRLNQRSANAQRLYKHHNKLATLTVGRKRSIELANAQKQVWEQEKIKLFLLENEYIKSQNNAFKVQDLQKKIDQQKEWVYQSKMGYLEHLWHLRKRPDVKEQADSLFEKQNQLNTTKLLPYLPPNEKESQNISAVALKNKIAIKEDKTLSGNVINIQLDNEKYEIIVYENGTKKYYKNDKPITALTYRFETERKFGKMLQNIRLEIERKNLRIWFEDKINSL